MLNYIFITFVSIVVLCAVIFLLSFLKLVNTAGKLLKDIEENKKKIDAKHHCLENKIANGARRVH